MKWEMGDNNNDNDISLCISYSQTNHVLFIDRNDKIDYPCIECFCCAGRHQLFESYTFFSIFFVAHTYDANIQLTTQKAHTKIKGNEQNVTKKWKN